MKCDYWADWNTDVIFMLTCNVWLHLVFAHKITESSNIIKWFCFMVNVSTLQLEHFYTADLCSSV